LLIVATEKEDIKWANLFFQGLKLNMEKWLLGGTKPSIVYVAHVMDMLLRKWFPLEGHHIIGWFMEMNCEKDEENIVQLVIGNLTPITFKVVKKATMFMNENLQFLHNMLLGTRETRYRTTISPTCKRSSTKWEVTKKEKMGQVT
jgi:hypothetical protein